MSALLLRKNLINAIDSHEDIIMVQHGKGRTCYPIHRLVILPLVSSTFFPLLSSRYYSTIFKPLFHPQTGTFWPSFVLKNRTIQPYPIWVCLRFVVLASWLLLAHYTGFPPNKVPPAKPMSKFYSPARPGPVIECIKTSSWFCVFVVNDVVFRRQSVWVRVRENHIQSKRVQDE